MGAFDCGGISAKFMSIPATIAVSATTAGTCNPKSTKLCMTIAVNPWGDGFESFLARLDTIGVDDWRVRRCGDPASAVLRAIVRLCLLTFGRLSKLPSLNSGRAAWATRRKTPSGRS